MPDKWRMTQWRKDNPDRSAAINRRSSEKWAASHPKATKAHRAVRVAIANGSLVRPTQCEHCGIACKPEASHTDYANQLDVEWLCRPCHKRKDNFS